MRQAVCRLHTVRKTKADQALRSLVHIAKQLDGVFHRDFSCAEPATEFSITGKQLRHIVKYMLREESFIDAENNR